MANVTISTFMMRVRNTAKGDPYHELNDLPPGYDLLDLLADYLAQLGTEPAEDTFSKLLLSASQVNTKGRSISGNLERGEYGIKNRLLDVKRRRLSYQRRVSDAEMMPFYILAAIPPRGNRALMAFELAGNPAIKLQFEHGFQTFIDSKCQNCDLEIERLVPEKLLKQYVQGGRVTKLRFVRLRVRDEIADAIRSGLDEREMNMDLELQVRAKRGVSFMDARRVQALLQGNMDAKDFIQVKDFDYDTIKVEVDVGGKRRTMDVRARDDFRADYIAEKVEMVGGHPTFTSIDAAAREIVREILRSLKLEVPGVQ